MQSSLALRILLRLIYNLQSTLCNRVLPRAPIWQRRPYHSLVGRVDRFQAIKFLQQTSRFATAKVPAPTLDVDRFAGAGEAKPFGCAFMSFHFWHVLIPCVRVYGIYFFIINIFVVVNIIEIFVIHLH